MFDFKFEAIKSINSFDLNGSNWHGNSDLVDCILIFYTMGKVKFKL